LCSAKLLATYGGSKVKQGLEKEEEGGGNTTDHRTKLTYSEGFNYFDFRWT